MGGVCVWGAASERSVCGRVGPAGTAGDAVYGVVPTGGVLDNAAGGSVQVSVHV